MLHFSLVWSQLASGVCGGGGFFFLGGERGGGCFVVVVVKQRLILCLKPLKANSSRTHSHAPFVVAVTEMAGFARKLG